MPELPEAETVRRVLQATLPGAVLRSYRSFWESAVFGLSVPDFQRKIKGKRVRNVLRRGKRLALELDQGFILAHLRMTGKFYIAQELPENRRPLNGYFTLESGEYLIFYDTRRFGRLQYLEDKEAYDSFCDKLGPEPLDESFTLARFRAMLAGRKRGVKALLLDQAFIAGLGNIYADECLFQAGLHPETPADRIPPEGVRELRAAIRSILRRAIRLQGTTIINFTSDGHTRGSFGGELQVYGRTGLPCPRCGAPIVKIRAAGRGTHLCPGCQRV